jgi:hypothetical protein
MALAFGGCVKTSSSNPTSQFVGTWKGSSPCGMTYITFSAGSGNMVTTPGSVGKGSCIKNKTWDLYTSGNSISGSWTDQDLCGNNISFGMAGSISNGTLTLTMTGSSSTGSGGTCVFTGTK